MEKFTIANETAFRYVDAGSGDNTILLIHGYLESIEIWENVISKMGKSNRMIAFDVPGHGISEVKGEIHTIPFLAETAAMLLDKLEVEKVTIVGHSMGGYIALALAKLRPDLCTKLVLLHSTPDSDTPEKAANREREIAIIESGRKELLARTNPSKSFAKDNKKKFAEEIENMELQAMITDDDGIVALLKGMSKREDFNDIVENLGDRAMIVFGEKDQYMPLEYCQSVAEKHKKAKILWLEESGHNGHIEQEAKFIDELTQFISA